MSRKAPGANRDPIDLVLALAVISGKWKVRIVYLLMHGTKRFGELRRLLPGVHRGTLSYELRRLEAAAVVRRTQYPTMPPTVEYSLTHLGKGLKPVLLALCRWVEKRESEDMEQQRRMKN